jgi:hypothetical protein
MELGEALRIGPKIDDVLMSQIRPFQGLGLSWKGLLSSVAYGDTPFQRKGAPALRPAALETQNQIP